VTKRRLIDLVQDHEQHAAAAGKLFTACDRGDIVLVVLDAVLAECVFVLESFYNHPRGEIATALRTLVSSPGIQIARLAVTLDALDRYRRSNVHFVDCLIAATAAADDLAVATFDRDFRKFIGIRVETG